MLHRQRIELLNNRNKRLVGTFCPLDSQSIVIFAPGSSSDKSSEGRFDCLAGRFHEVNLSTLAFDFAGCGESEDDVATLAKRVEDFKAILNYAKGKGYKKIGVFGHSLGGLISLMAYSSDIQAIAMMGGLTGPMNFKWDAMLTDVQKKELQEKKRVTVKGTHNLQRKEIVFGHEYFQEFSAISHQNLLESVKCPVLMIHGDGDDEERAFHTLSQVSLSYLPKGSEIQLIPGANHGFWGDMGRVADSAVPWLKKALEG